MNARNHREVEEEQGGQNLIRAEEVMGEVRKAIEELPQSCRQVLKPAYFKELKMMK